MSRDVPVLDLTAWHAADAAGRAGTGAALDAALRETGAFLLRGHGIPPELTDRMRTQGRAFFALPATVKQQYAVSRPYDNGWRGLGALDVGAVDGAAGTPDLHEAYHVGPSHSTGDPAYDARYYPRNKWPEEQSGLRETALEYTGHMTRVAHSVLGVLASVLGLPEEHFTSRSQRATWTQNINWYPSLRTVGGVAEGQMRVGPHTDFGTLSLLDRQQGVGGLEVWNEADGWFRPPYEQNTLVVNLGDLMNLWTDGRWRSLRHRVLAPSDAAPDEELVSLVYFFETDPDTEVVPLSAPTGGGEGMSPVIAGESILEKVGASLTLG
ncbi:isopenicillin N synthase-like dioxygenase [Streptomyces sp. Ag109_O5-1]|uniref:isopenicillin N synthase family dioxygenase n=1 Tax=Streptomyces sp. Ag109_O5-1 TaxID=1938851 RepID=UPI000F4E283E|nr:2-oxoglutarate and iron-dependent oxygenase domain-containing protein [Streptomyces sp. Ag109_O5-1]RPE38951.1 isopenicillin N synthase-like dioxygenase [Streptomyces sp. Ag109_O5-1]